MRRPSKVACWQTWRLQPSIYSSAEQIEWKQWQNPAFRVAFPLPVAPLTWWDLLGVGEKVAMSLQPCSDSFSLQKQPSIAANIARSNGILPYGKLDWTYLTQGFHPPCYSKLNSDEQQRAWNSVFIHVQSLSVCPLKLFLCQIQQWRLLQVHVSFVSPFTALLFSQESARHLLLTRFFPWKTGSFPSLNA